MALNSMEGFTLLLILFPLIFILTLFLSNRLLGTVFTPFMVYSGIWSLAGFLLGLHWISYVEIQAAGWFGITLAWLGVLFGSVLGRSTRFRHKTQIKYEIVKRRLFVVLIFSSLCGILGIMWRLKILLSYFGSLSDINLSTLRYLLVTNTLQFPALSSYLATLSLTAMSIAIVFFFRYGFARGLVFLPLILVAAGDYINAGRGGMYLVICMIVSAFIIYSGEKELIKIISKWSKTIMIVISVGFLLTATFLVLVTREGDANQYSQFKNPAAIAYTPSLSGMYTYFTGNIVSIGMALSEPSPMDGGTLLFAPVVNLVNKTNGGSSVDQWYPFKYIPVQFNTYSYLYEFYTGFSWVGIIIGSLLLGFFSESYFERFRRGDINALIPSLYLTTACGFSIIQNYFTHTSFIIALFTSVLAIKWSQNKIVNQSPINFNEILEIKAE